MGENWLLGIMLFQHHCCSVLSFLNYKKGTSGKKLFSRFSGEPVRFLLPSMSHLKKLPASETQTGKERKSPQNEDNIQLGQLSLEQRLPEGEHLTSQLCPFFYQFQIDVLQS